jgi:hypothetical protein
MPGGVFHHRLASEEKVMTDEPDWKRKPLPRPIEGHLMGEPLMLTLARTNWDGSGIFVWLDPGMRNVVAASELLRPCDPRLMQCYPVSTRINGVVNDDAECSAPVELARTQGRLFL